MEKPVVTLESLQKEFDFLPLMTQILEKLPHDQNETTKLVSQLHEKFKKAEEFLDQLEGSDLTPTQQKEQHQQYLKELKEKCELIEKYKKLKVLQPDTTDTMNIDG